MSRDPHRLVPLAEIIARRQAEQTAQRAFEAPSTSAYSRQHVMTALTAMNAARLEKSLERQKKAAPLFAEGVPCSRIAERFGVDIATVTRWKQAWRRAGGAT